MLLLLASTNFTVVTGVGYGQFHWEYFRYVSRHSWGVPYEFPYSLAVVLAYLAAYVTGAAAYCTVYRRSSKLIGLAGILLCAAGLASFAIESTHWFSDHGRSWIASAPIALLALALAAAVLQYRGRAAERTDESGLSHEAADAPARM